MASVAVAGDKYDIAINDDRTTSDQLNPRVAAGQGGHWAILWVDKRNSTSDIYCQFLDSAGNRQGQNFKINDNDSSIPQFEASIAGNNSGQFSGVWKDYRNGNYPFNPDIYLSKIDTLTTYANRNVTGELPDTSVESPDIALFYDGSAVVVWSDYRNDNWDIYGQRIATTGEAVGANFKINDEAGIFQQHSPRVTAFSNGGFVVVWYDNRFGNDDIFGQKYDAAFNRVGTNIKISDEALSTRQAFPAVSCDDNGRIFVAWVDWRNGTYPQNPDIYLRRFRPDGTAYSPSTRVNLNDGGRAQKDVSLCSDRLGNICVVWADSSGGQWDALGQIINENGALSGSSFKIHQLDSGRQLQPDVATDGYKFFFAWADSRAGNFDIYATVKQYNNPALAASPAHLDFTMEAGGAIPAAQSFILSNAGYGALSWSVNAGAAWLGISPGSGSTPATLTVSITTDTLKYGSYYAGLRFTRTDNNDSSLVVPVYLNVTAPIMQFDPDSLYFRVFAALGNPASQKLMISNSGSGDYTWTASENASWLNLDKTAGVSVDSISISLDITGLAFADYREPIVFSSPEAANSPETVWVHLQLIGNMPYLSSRPETLNLAENVGEDISSYLKIVNLGEGALQWQVASPALWLNLDRNSGADNDSIRIDLNSAGLIPGRYHSEVIIWDSASFNQLITVPVSFHLISPDTVEFVSANILPDGSGVMSFSLGLTNPAKGGYIPFAYDSSYVRLDSIIFNPGILPSFVEFGSHMGDAGRGEVGFRINAAMFSDSLISPGKYSFAQLHFTAYSTDAVVTVDTLPSDTAGVYILDTLGNRFIPSVVSGELVIGDHTAVDEPAANGLPHDIHLAQNYPNPFNSETVIMVALPRAGTVRLEIYNILGQAVWHLQDGHLGAGTHRILWNGRMNNGASAPSGIYFYQLDALERTLTKKLVLLK